MHYKSYHRRTSYIIRNGSQESRKQRIHQFIRPGIENEDGNKNGVESKSPFIRRSERFAHLYYILRFYFNLVLYSVQEIARPCTGSTFSSSSFLSNLSACFTAESKYNSFSILPTYTEPSC